ncbi:hypothetical protein [Oceanobacillus damuensis]|uniref:hypothetical protein n=1 Tax=Oceanobacillus damuensis TaxID=937928 RepID=UPI00082A5D53|nr:hypothetical protein [Oceanobacillus damuensis]
MSLYLIRYSNDKFVVKADSSIDAIKLWIDEKNREEKEVYQSKRKFNPNDFSIERLGTYHGIMEAPE